MFTGHYPTIPLCEGQPQFFLLLFPYPLELQDEIITNNAEINKTTPRFTFLFIILPPKVIFFLKTVTFF